MSTSTSAVRATFSVPGGKRDFHLLRLVGEEGISELFEFHLKLACMDNDVSFSEMVGQDGLVSLITDNGTRNIHGMINAFQHRGPEEDHTIYHVSLVPRVWKLLNRQDVRIFQDKTTEQIVAQVLEGAGIPSDGFKITVGQSPPSWDYCVQYRESDWAFISRLLEEHGYYYFFSHTAKGHTLVIANDYQVHPQISDNVEVPCHEAEALLPEHEYIYRFHFQERICSGKFTINDYDPLKPKLSLLSRSEEGQDTSLEVYDFPGEYKTPEFGGDLAGIRLEEIQAGRLLGEGESDCIRLVAGHFFVLTGHDRQDLSGGKYVLTRVRHQCESHEDLFAGALESRTEYSNDFQCIPREVPFRPQQKTPKPNISGVQTAVVVGPPGEEIYTDQYGRIKVQFHWDRLGQFNHDSSCWMRVSQYWASQSWGALYLPRIGDEVLVEFIEGDPDRPIITGRVYNAINTPPCSLPADKTKSTVKSNSSPGGDGFNEIRFEDKKGGEELYTHAQKNQTEVVNNNMSTSVGASQSISVGKNRKRTIGKDETIEIGGNRTETVDLDDTITIVGNRTETVNKDETITIVGNRTETVIGNETVTIEKLQALTVLKDRTKTLNESEIIAIGGSRTELIQTDKYLDVWGKRQCTIKGSDSNTVKGDSSQAIGGDKVTIVTGDFIEHSLDDRLSFTLGARDDMVTSKYLIRCADKIMVMALKGIQLKVGSSVIDISPSEIKINGTQVKINCV